MKSLDVMVPIMAVCYFVLTVGILVVNFRQLPAVLGRIFAEAFGLRQMAAGGFGAVLMNGVKRGLFSNEAGSGSAPCAAAAAACDDPVKMGFVQALGVLIDTVVICSCTAFLMLLVPQDLTAGLSGMDLLQTAMQYHLGGFGTVFIAAILALFSFSTFLGVLYYARGNVAYLCGDNWWSQTVYKLIALVMLLIGGLQAYTVVWDLGDVGIGLMTIFNMIALYPLSGEAMDALNDYEKTKKAAIMQIPRRTLPEWKRVRRGISFRSVQCLNGGHRNAVLLFYLGKLLCCAFQLAGAQRLGERHRRGIQVGKAQILAYALQGVCCAEGFFHVLFLQGSFQIVEAVILGKQQHKLADHCFVVQATEYFVVICAHLCITFLDRHDMLIPFCPADCLFLFSIKIIS